VLIPIVLNGKAGAKYGVPFPVLLRSAFGRKGALIAALFRALVGCGWFGIQTWIGGSAIYQLFLLAQPALASSPVIGGWIDINASQLFSFLIFWLLNMLIIDRGMDTIKRLQSWSSFILIIMGLLVIIWAWKAIGSIPAILHKSEYLKGLTNFTFWGIFWPGLTAVIGFWATLSLNIPDFTRYAKSNRAQTRGQVLGLPLSMALFSFIGIFATSASQILFGETIWNPLDLIQHFHSVPVIVIALVGILLATVSTNIAANVVAAANDISNISPDRISFKSGGFVTGIIGLLIFPWKLMADPQGFIFIWLIGCSIILGAVAGIMICDFYIIKKGNLQVPELFNPSGIYGKWNSASWISLGLAAAPVIPGFLMQLGILDPAEMSPIWNTLYTYGWFITSIVAASCYWLLTKNKIDFENSNRPD
jgi:NCS1 family nucleobase:cation symporter-1